VLIPWNPATAKVVVKHTGQELAAAALSAHAPTVTFDPVSNVVSDTLFCSWSATDADGDELDSTLLLSTDNGETWEGVASGIPGTQFDLDASFWPEATQAQLRVLVSDGLHTSEATSNDFSVPERPPLAFIVSPDDGAVHAHGDPWLLQAGGYDNEDGPLGDEAFTWSSDRDGALGSGEELIADGLSRGHHTLTLRAADRDGHFSEQTVSVWVGTRVYLPLTVR
jgi:hypothetical protein